MNRRAAAIRLCAVLIPSAHFAVACGGSGGEDSAAVEEKSRLTVVGSSTVAPLMNEIAKRFEAAHPGARIDVQTGGSSRGIADVARGLADIGMVSRDLRPEETATLGGHAIARDGVGVIVHASNPVGELTDRQIVSIFKGEIDRWSDVGGPAGPITVVSKAEGRSTLEVFTEHFKLRSERIRASVVIGDNEQGIKSVAADPLAIGFVSIGAAETSAARGAAIELLALDGVAATSQNVANGRYPLARSLTLVTRGEPQGLARKLIDFARSAAVDDLVRGLSFVPVERDRP
jgi:phosphate transport system substrate-binding protein